MTTMPPLGGAPRLVLLLKSAPGTGAKIAHQAGYAFYGSPARWHKVTAGKPAPKGAPVAHHPQAAGQHVPAAHMTDEQWAALQLPDSNVNAGPFNKALSKLKEWADSGNVTAIVGAGFGTNTYGKKLATIANHLLALYGSEHKVVAGQKAGEHAAVKAPAGDATPPDMDSPEDMATTYKDGKAVPPAAASVPSDPAQEPKTDPVAGELQMPDFQEGKTTTGVKALYEKVGQKVIDHGHAGNVSVLEDLPEPHKKMWQGKTPNSKKLLALHADALAYAKGEKAAPAAADPGPKEGDTKPAADGGTLVLKDGYWVKQGGDEAPAGDPFGGLKLPDHLKDYLLKPSVTLKNGKTVSAKEFIDGLLADGYGNPEYFASAKGSQAGFLTKPGKQKITLNDKQMFYADAAFMAKKQGAGETKGPATHPATLGNLSAQHLQNLQSIPWDKQLLPDSNSNAGSHNKAVGKIKAMAEAGDKAGLQAFIDGKAGAKQTYAKKQALLAQTALAALGGEATAAVPLQQPAAAPAQPPASAPEPEAADKYPLVNAWKQALADGKHPTKEQAEAYEALVESDPDAAMEYFMDAVNANVPAGDFTDDKFDDALQEAHQKVHGLHGEALFGKVPAAPDLSPADGLTQTQIDAIEKIAGLSDGSLEALVDSPGLPENVNAAIKKKLAEKQAAPAQAPAAPKTATAPKTTLHNTLPGHSKSWSVHVAPNASGGFDMVTEYGKIGGTQQKTVKSFATADEAHAEKKKLINSKEAKGYSVVDTDYGHKVVVPAAVEQGPKEGDTKQGADGLLVLKDGHWVKMNTSDDGAGDWAYNAEDPGMSGAPTIGNHEGLIAYLPGQGAEFHTGESMMANTGDPALQAENLQDLVQKMADAGYQVPPQAMLQKLDPSFSATASKPAKPAKPAKKPAAVVKIEAVDPDAAMAWINADPGKADGSFIETLPSKSAQTWFVKWGNAYRGRLKKFGPESWQTKIALGRALGAAFGHPGLALLTTGEWIPAKQNGVPIEQAKQVETDPAKVKAAAIALKQHMLDTAKGKTSAAPAQSSPAPAATAGAMPSVDSWIKTGGQGGSNPGGKFKDPSGQEWYVKWPDDAEAVKSEVLAANLYALAGLSSQDCMLVTKGGKTAIATKWVNIKKAGSAAELAAVDGVQSGFAVDAWLGNWDVVGLSLDNLQIGPDGKAHRVDAGGSLEYRAQGEKKPFGNSVDEIDTLRDPAKNPKAAAVFGKMTKADITASVAKVAAIDDDLIRALVEHHGPGSAADKKKLADTLIARKADLLAKYPAAKPKKAKPAAPVFRIPEAPDFANWNGPGQGLSSKAVFNKQNTDLANEIHALGKAGNVEKLKAMTYQPLDANGAPAGDPKPILQHPSKHIPAYFKDVLHSMTTPYVSPKIAMAEAIKNVGSAFQAMKALFPSVKALKDAAVQIGRYALIGKAKAGHPLANWKPQLKSRKQGTIDEKGLFLASQKGFASLSAVERQAIKDYTGSSYGGMNEALMQGKGHDKAYNATKGMEKASVLLPAGTVLSRRFSLDKDADGNKSKALHDQNMAKILQAGEGAILQDFGIISTSCSSSFWSGYVHLRITVGEGVKGLYVASDPSGGGQKAISNHPGESEIMLPPNTKFMITKIHPKKHSFTDETGTWGGGYSDEHVIEVTVLPNV